MSQSFKTAYSAVLKCAGEKISPIEKVIVACSGGADSLALAIVAKKVFKDLYILIIDHNLQKGSAKVASCAAEKLKVFGFENITVQKIEVKQTKQGIEADARNARYKAFEKFAAQIGASKVLLAHTFDDQAESVFLGLMRGSGSKSLKGMAQNRGIFCRPFLFDITRSDCEAICNEAKMDFYIDPMKSKRSELRNDIFPFLEAKLGKGIKGNLVQTSKILSEDDEALSAIANKLLQYLLKDSALKVSALKDQPVSIRKRMYLKILQIDASKEITHKHLDAIDELVINWHGQKPLSIPHFSVHRNEGYLYFEKHN